MKIREKFLVYGSPLLGQAEIKEVNLVLESGWLGTGPKVAQFENEFAHYKGKESGQSLAVNSCTAALHLSLLAAGVGAGDEVITTVLTFCATANAIIHTGATPVFVDVDSKSMNIDPEKIIEKISKKTKAIVVVHFAGRPCDMDSICEIAKKYNLLLIEDCAHAIESEYKGKKTGTIGDFGCFSFYVTKNIVTGEGGMILAKKDEHISRMKVLALHGMSKDAWSRFSDKGYKHYLVDECGFKYNMTDMQAAIGIHQLREIDKFWEKRKKIWDIYNNAFSDMNITIPSDVKNYERHAYHLYTILVNESRAGISRDQFLEKMTERKIGVGVHYLSLAEHPYYQRNYGCKPEDYPNAMKIGRETVSLPLSPKLSLEDVNDVIAAVKDIVRP